MDNAISIGLLPDLERTDLFLWAIVLLAGARQILLSYEAMKKADEIARKITYFELSVEPGYMDEYMAALFFPHTDLNQISECKNIIMGYTIAIAGKGGTGKTTIAALMVRLIKEKKLGSILAVDADPIAIWQKH